jgi:hypothetical protein
MIRRTEAPAVIMQRSGKYGKTTHGATNARKSDYPDDNRIRIGSVVVHQKILAPADERR